MRFQFRLQKALHFLEMKETVKRMEVSSVLQKIDFLKGRIEDLEKNIRFLLGKRPELLADWAPYQTAKLSLDAKDIKKFEKLLKEEKIALERKQRELSRLLMRKKGLESLRDKRLAEYKLVESRREQKRLDDAFSIQQAVVKKGM